MRKPSRFPVHFLAALLSSTLGAVPMMAGARAPRSAPVAESLPAARLTDGYWAQTASAPGARSEHAAIHDLIGHEMVVIGGWTGSNYEPPTNETLDLDLDPAGSPGWSVLPAAGDAPFADHAPVIYDPARRRLVVVLSDPWPMAVWELTLTGTPTWSQLSTTGMPAGVTLKFPVYDAPRDRIVLLSSDLTQTWALSLAEPPVWTHLLPFGTPPPTGWATNAVHDPVRDRMIVIGTSGSGTSERRIWTLKLAGSPYWSQTVAPTGMDYHIANTAIYDPVRDRVVVFGGYWGGSGTAGDTWAFSLSGAPQWTSIVATGPDRETTWGRIERLHR